MYINIFLFTVGGCDVKSIRLVEKLSKIKSQILRLGKGGGTYLEQGREYTFACIIGF